METEFTITIRAKHVNRSVSIWESPIIFAAMEQFDTENVYVFLWKMVINMEEYHHETYGKPEFIADKIEAADKDAEYFIRKIKCSLPWKEQII